MGDVVASTNCAPYPRDFRSEVNFSEFSQHAYQQQHLPQWCWAACISMLFSYYGHPVSQSRIVSDAYGFPVNMPATSGIVIAQQLDRSWIDDHGNAFNSRVTAAYDFDAKVFKLNNAWLINELHLDRPVVLGTVSHAVVMTAMDYSQTPFGPNVKAIGVFDPWPGIGARMLTRFEMAPMHLNGGLRFAASVRVK